MAYLRPPSLRTPQARILGALLLAVCCWCLGGGPRSCSALAILLPGLPQRGRPGSSFGDGLRDWVGGHGSEDDLVCFLDDNSIEEDEDLAAVAEYLDRLRDPTTPIAVQRRIHRGLPHVVDSCLDIEGDAHYRAVADLLLPAAGALFEDCLAHGGKLRQRTALALLEILFSFNDMDGVDRLVRAVRRPLLPDDGDWSRVFSLLDGEHPFWEDVRDALAEPLPPGFIAVAFLDAMNDLALSGDLDWHPFSSEAGRDRIADWYEGGGNSDLSWARSATTALPFLEREYRQGLLELARQHPSPPVRIEASWAAAVTGDESGIAELAEWALDPVWSNQACRYLQELRREDDIPPPANEPDFAAVASLSAWLADGYQYGVAPEQVTVYDRRQLFWPPTGDERTLYLLRYTVRQRGRLVSGIGIVGDLTYAMLDMFTDAKLPEDLYGLYCAWELDYHGSPEAPGEITAEAGRAILARYNPGFPTAP